MSDNPNSTFFSTEQVGTDEPVIVVCFTQPQMTDELNIVDLGNDLFALVEKSDCTRIVLDMNLVEYVTSSVLGKLITLHRKLHRSNGTMAICRLTTGLSEILTTSRLIEYFQVADDVQSAVELISSSD